MADVDVPLQYGARSSWILRLQQLLNAHGAGLQEDGVFGPSTSAAMDNATQSLMTSPTGARDVIGTGLADAQTAGEVYDVLLRAFYEYDQFYGAAPKSTPTKKAPLEKTVTMTMGPAEASKMAQSLGLAPKQVPWGPIFIGAGVIAGIAAIAVYLKSRPRPARA